MTLTGIAVAALAFVLGVVCLAIYQILTQHGRILLRLEMLEARRPESQPQIPQGRPEGTVLHDFELPLLGGGEMRLSQWRGQRLLLVFFNPDCSHCRQMVPQLATLPAVPAEGEPRVLLISMGAPEANRSLLEDVKVPVLLQEFGELAMLYGVPGTPSGYLVDESGMTSRALITGAGALLAAARSKAAEPQDAPAASMVEQPAPKAKADLTHSQLLRDGLRAGAVAPDFLLPTPQGEQIALSQYRGRRVLLVFSDPQCTPCNTLAPHLEAAHRANPDYQMLMVSRGNPDLVRNKINEHGVTFPVVMQRKWEISREYGIFAVPVAFPIDEAGIISREVVTGLDPIVSLISQVGNARQEAIPANR